MREKWCEQRWLRDRIYAAKEERHVIYIYIAMCEKWDTAAMGEGDDEYKAMRETWVIYSDG